jgi:hypothetical protein
MALRNSERTASAEEANRKVRGAQVSTRGSCSYAPRAAWLVA